LGAITALTTRYRYEKKYPIAKGTKMRIKFVREVLNGSPLPQDERFVFIRRTDIRERRVVCQALKATSIPTKRLRKRGTKRGTLVLKQLDKTT
jgi:hypothetical protein